MFDSAILDIAIGMVFVYFLLSLLTVNISELIARIFALRSSTLYNAIRNLLADPKIGSDLIEKFWKNPLIATLSRNDAGLSIGIGRHKPSYIPANLFALALLDAIGEKVQPGGALKTPDEVGSAVNSLEDDQLRKLLLALIGADGSMQQIQQDLAKWFDQYMERVSGWYKRKTQAINLALALVLAVILNADSLAIFNALSTNPKLSAAAVDVATNYLRDNPSPALTTTRPVTDTQSIPDLAKPMAEILSLEDTLAKLSMPITWAPADEKVPRDLTGWFYKILGLLMTALLVSLGAPFWFDLLNKFVNLRSTGRVPAKAEVSNSSSGSGETLLPGDATKPVVEKPSSPSGGLENLADKAVQVVEDYKASGRLTSRAEEDEAAIQFLKPEIARRAWVVTDAQLLGALAAAFERRSKTYSNVVTSMPVAAISTEPPQPTVTSQPGAETELQRLADEAVRYVQTLKAGGQLKLREDDVAIARLLTQVTERGLDVTDVELRDAVRDAFKRLQTG